MRIRYQKLKGKEMLADKEGRLLGSVRRIHIDSKKKMVTGLVFKGKVMSGERWCKVRGVTRVGEDVVYLASMRMVIEDEAPGRDVKDLMGLPVTSLDGRRLGSLDDVVVDIKTWQLVGIVLDGGGVVEIGEQAVFGPDTILLREGAGDEIEDAPAEQSGFLARVFQGDAEPEPKKKKKTSPSPSRSRSRSRTKSTSRKKR
ncbi:MAG: PRC-barrel domain-containing protein [Deltaproteobacteria bacterium]|nr:PRC-barrel domain-containing protein [Deltaproteobacteria bacterium]